MRTRWPEVKTDGLNAGHNIMEQAQKAAVVQEQLSISMFIFQRVQERLEEFQALTQHLSTAIIHASPPPVLPSGEFSKAGLQPITGLPLERVQTGHGDHA